MGHHGVQFEDRWKQVAERVDALKTIWREERPSFRGKFVRFDPFWQYPKPIQQPHPRIVLGTLDTPFGRAQVAKYGDGWLPLTFDVATTRASIADVHARMRALGRDPTHWSLAVLPRRQAAERRRAETGTRYRRRPPIMRLPVADEPTVLRALDHYARRFSLLTRSTGPVGC